VTYAALPDMTFSNLVVVVLREGPLFEPSIPLLNGYLPESYKKLVWEKLIKEKSITEEMVWDDNNLNENINDTQTRIIACNKKLEVMSMKRTEH
jgi:peroxiredoxin family protein